MPEHHPDDDLRWDEQWTPATFKETVTALAVLLGAMAVFILGVVLIVRWLS